MRVARRHSPPDEVGDVVWLASQRRPCFSGLAVSPGESADGAVPGGPGPWPAGSWRDEIGWADGRVQHGPGTSSVAVIQPAVTWDDWTRTQEVSDKGGVHDYGATGACRAIYRLSLGGPARALDLERPLQLPIGYLPAWAGAGDRWRMVTECWREPSEADLDALGRAAGLGLVELTAAGRAGPVRVASVFAPTLEGHEVRVLLASWFDARVGECVFATLEGTRAGAHYEWDAVVFTSQSPAGARELLRLDGAPIPGGPFPYFDVSQVPVLNVQPPPAPVWLQLTADRDLLFMDSAGWVYDAGRVK